MASRTFADMSGVTGFSYDGTSTLSLTGHITWTTDMSANDWITVEEDETFDGAGYTIDMTGVNDCAGLFDCSGGDAGANATIKKLGVLNGITANNGGFIVRKEQKFFTVDDCYSTGDISGYAAGGICGFVVGHEGSCTITNCYSTGDLIYRFSGGICGSYAGYRGSCTITNCYSTGDNVLSTYSGGICGAAAGREGVCTITNCYSTSNNIGNSGGGICGRRAGYSGSCTVTNCYSTSNNIGNSAGGICGDAAGYSAGLCTVTNCYSTDFTDLSHNTGTGISPMNGNWNKNLISNGSVDNSLNATGPNTITPFAPVAGSYPILVAFQALPWEDNYTLVPFYDLYDIAAQFDSGNNAGLGGDPFIWPVYGNMYETPMKATSYRMLQGRKLIMNMSQRKMSKQEGEVVEQYYKQVNNEEAPSSLVTEGVYINKAFLKADGQTMEYDFDTGKGQMSTDYFTIKQETKKHGDGKYLSSPIVKQIHVSFNHSIYGRMTATLNHYSNPQMKSGVSIHYKKANHATKELTGLLVREYKCKSMECRKLHKTKKLQGKVGTNKVLGYLNDTPKN